MVDLNRYGTAYLAGMRERERDEIARLEERAERRWEDLELVSKTSAPCTTKF